MDDPFITRQTLLLRASNPSDEEAWEDFVSYYESFIQMVLGRLLFNLSDSDDLRQDILLKLWAKLKSYDQQKSKFRTWLSTVIRNTVLNFLDKSGRRKTLLAPEGEILLAADSKNELEQHIQTEWEAYASTMALEKIKPLFSEKAIKIFYMSLDNIPVETISKELEISADSIYKMKGRVISRLHKEIQLIRSETEF
jgi:RNA polymerase sigma factor (sigma-70 family)